MLGKGAQVFCLLLLSLPCLGFDGQGKILRVEFIGSQFDRHPDIVQFRLEGGLTEADCDATWAGIRKTDEHLISALLAAKMADKAVQVYLNTQDKYYSTRCIIHAIAYP